MSDIESPPAAEPEGDDNKPAGIDFLDFVFTLAITVALSPAILSIDGYEGIAAEGWLKAGAWPTLKEFFHLCVFGLCFLTLTLSWFGYHASIKKKPLKYEGISGMLRFILDVLLVVIYAFLFLHFKNLDFVLVLLLVIHFLFFIWDILKVVEHKSKYTDMYGNYEWRRFRRMLVTLSFFVMLTLLYCFAHHLPERESVAGSTEGRHGWPSLVLAVGLSIYYRANKMYTIGVDWLVEKIDRRVNGGTGGWIET